MTKRSRIDVSEEILLKLPVKSLLRFKCVSKHWHDRISHSSFTGAHLQRNIGDNTVVAIVSDANVKILHKNASCDKLITKDNLELPDRYYQHIPNFFCSCDGIVLFRKVRDDLKYYDLVLYNPNIKKYKILELSRPAFAFDIYAIGYDYSIDDYKLVRISMSGKWTPPDWTPKCPPHIVEVTAMKSNEWRSVSSDLNFCPSDIMKRPALSLKGTVYWLIRGPRQAILSFCLANETFREMSLPSREVESLLEMQGKLCLVSYLDISGSKIWIMKDETWVIVPLIWNKLSHFRFGFIEGGALLSTSNTGAVYIHGMKKKTIYFRGMKKKINGGVITDIDSKIVSAIVCGKSLILP